MDSKLEGTIGSKQQDYISDALKDKPAEAGHLKKAQGGLRVGYSSCIALF